MTMHQVEFFFHYPGSIADALAGALSPEASLSEVPKTRAHVTRTSEGIRILIDADDLGALRAAINSYLRWADAAERAARTGEERG